VPFKWTHPFASFSSAAVSHPETRVELVRPRNQKVFFQTSAFNSEEMRPVVVDLANVRGEIIFIRLVDDHSGGWGILISTICVYDQRPNFPNEFDPPDNDVSSARGGTDAALSEGFPPVPFAISLKNWVGQIATSSYLFRVVKARRRWVGRFVASKAAVDLLDDQLWRMVHPWSDPR